MEKSRHGRRDRLIKEKSHDTYEERRKWPEPTVCSDCKALFSNGRWCWLEAPEYVYKICCPACQRIADNYPAGELFIKGLFFAEHREEILNLINNTESLEKKEHPLERLMDIADEEVLTRVTTTGIHLARRIGEALVHAYQGDLDFTYGDAEKSIRVTWSR
jgi:hypothetical protein